LLRYLNIRGVMATDSNIETIMNICEETEPQKADFTLDIYILLLAPENNIFNTKPTTRQIFKQRYIFILF
jgi:hypothetical protein